MPSADFDALRDHYQSMSDRMAANPEMDLVALRSMLEELATRAKEPEGVSYAESDVDGMRALWGVPDNAAYDRVILYFHGGGFVSNSIDSHRKMAAHLAKATGARVLLPEYRLAPEHPFPSQLDDAVRAYHWMLGQGIGADRIATAGDSAGGNLAVSTVLKLRETGQPLPAAIVGFSPWLDMEHLGKTLETNAETDALVSREVVAMMSAMFLGESPPTDPLANPLHADLAGLPPLLLIAGGSETLLNDSERLADRAVAAGVEVELSTYSGQQHVFTFMAGRAPEADTAIAEAGAWLRSRLGLS